MFALISQQAVSAFLSTLILSGYCLAQSTERVSLDSLGAEGNGDSQSASISADGRYVAFHSRARNLVPGDTNQTEDVFVHDRQTGVTERVSVSSTGEPGNNLSWRASISANGRYVAFDSTASNLVANDTNGRHDVFVHDRLTGVTERVSIDSSGGQAFDESFEPSISADGRFVAFESRADTLVAWDTNEKSDIFVHDRLTGVTERVSLSSSGGEANSFSGASAISADGRYVSFTSDANNLVSGDTNASFDIFVHDRQTGVTERASVNSQGAEGNKDSQESALSADGRVVVFRSPASNLVPGDTLGNYDIFVRDRLTGTTERVSLSSAGLPGNNASQSPAVSADGRYVAFESLANNLVPGDAALRDVFVHDRQTGVTERVSVSSSGDAANRHNWQPSLSADGRLVAYRSAGENLVSGDANQADDIFVHDRWSGLGTNSIYLAGPATAQAGAPIEFAWQTTRGGSKFWLAYSMNTNGSVIGGHSFDLGTPISLIATGTNSINGLGGLTTAPIPPRAVGHTLYFEVAARDASGVLYDSNVVAVTIS